MKIEKFLASDLAHITQLEPEGWTDIVPPFEFYVHADFCHPIKIVKGTKIVGLGSIIVHEDVAWFAHIIVDKTERKQGIGSLITKTLIELGEACETLYLIATELGAPVYMKQGFVIDTEYLFFEDVQLVKKAKISRHIQAYEAKFEPAILQLDQAVCGERRRCHLAKHLEQAYVYCNENRLEGCYFPTLGEGLIIASTKRAGLDLLALHLQSNTKVVFPKENENAMQFLQKHGIVPSSKAKRMRLGKARPQALGNIYNRIGGFVG